MNILKEVEIAGTVTAWLEENEYPGQMSPLTLSIVINALDSTGLLKDQSSNTQMQTGAAKPLKCNHCGYEQLTCMRCGSSGTLHR